MRPATLRQNSIQEDRPVCVDTVESVNLRWRPFLYDTHQIICIADMIDCKLGFLCDRPLHKWLVNSHNLADCKPESKVLSFELVNLSSKRTFDRIMTARTKCLEGGP